MEGFLDQDKAIILSYYLYPENDGHFTFITDHTKHLFEIHNARDSHNKKSTIRRFLKQSQK